MSRLAVIEEIEKQQLKTRVPHFSIGDTVKVHIRIIEGEKERVQVFSGTVIARKGKGISETFSLYRFAYGTGVERVFYLHSPRIANIEVSRLGKVRRSKLYYLRGTSGKASKVKELVGSRKEKEKGSVKEEKKAQSKEKEAPIEKKEPIQEKPQTDHSS